MARAAVVVAACALTLACASAGRRAPGATTLRAASGEPLQALFRAEVADDEGSATLRLTLRRWRSARFELGAADRFGRRLWSLSVAGSEGIWVDARADSSCRLSADGAVRLAEIALPLPASSLPAILLGEAPVAIPVGGGDDRGAPQSLELEDQAGRRWRIERAVDGSLLEWRLMTDQGARIEWHGRGKRRELRSESPRFAIDWTESAREPLTTSEPAWVAGRDEVPECGDETLP